MRSAEELLGRQSWLRSPACDGVRWVFEHVEEAIILEDDCLPHPTFFRYCQELLEYYRHDERVMYLVLDGVYLNRDGTAVFHEAAPPTVEELKALLTKIITRTMRLLIRLGAVIEEPDRTYLAETETDGPLKSLQAASCTYRIALGPRAGQKC